MKIGDTRKQFKDGPIQSKVEVHGHSAIGQQLNAH